jgi:hypothetical protein
MWWAAPSQTMDPCVKKVKRVKTGTGGSPESISFKCLSCLALLGFTARSKAFQKVSRQHRQRQRASLPSWLMSVGMAGLASP